MRRLVEAMVDDFDDTLQALKEMASETEQARAAFAASLEDDQGRFLA